MSFAITALVCAVLAAQDPEGDAPPPPPPASATELIERFRRLDKDQRNTVVRNMERRLQRVDDDVLQRIYGFERGMASYPVHSPPVWFLPRDYAPGAAARTLIAAGTSAHRTGAQNIRSFEFLPDLHARVTYDWQLGKAATIADDLDDDQRFTNYVNGYPLGTDHAVARILEALDSDPAQRELAAYFEHLYADRNGGVYAGITLLEAWSAGGILEMPDTDAIAFARRVLHTQSFVAPLPTDRRRERLYGKVRESFAAHREYRTLRLAAAASFVAAEPRIDATYEPLVRRCQWLWFQCGYDLDSFKTRLLQSGDRSTFLREIDAAIESSQEVVEGERQRRSERTLFLRALAQHELAARNG